MFILSEQGTGSVHSKESSISEIDEAMALAAINSFNTYVYRKPRKRKDMELEYEEIELYSK